MSEPVSPLKYKDQDAVLDFKFDYGQGWLAASETISTSTMRVTPGITLGTTSNTSQTATAWLSGGTAGTAYILTNKIVTNQGRTDERSMIIKVVSR